MSTSPNPPFTCQKQPGEARPKLSKTKQRVSSRSLAGPPDKGAESHPGLPRRTVGQQAMLVGQATKEPGINTQQVGILSLIPAMKTLHPQTWSAKE